MLFVLHLLKLINIYDFGIICWIHLLDLNITAIWIESFNTLGLKFFWNLIFLTGNHLKSLRIKVCINAISFVLIILLVILWKRSTIIGFNRLHLLKKKSVVDCIGNVIFFESWYVFFVILWWTLAATFQLIFLLIKILLNVLLSIHLISYLFVILKSWSLILTVY